MNDDERRVVEAALRFAAETLRHDPGARLTAENALVSAVQEYAMNYAIDCALAERRA